MIIQNYFVHYHVGMAPTMSGHLKSTEPIMTKVCGYKGQEVVIAYPKFYVLRSPCC